MKSNPWNKKNLTFLLILVVGISLYFIVSPFYSVSKLKNQQAPEIFFKWPSGQSAKLSDMKGKVVLVNFWASFCPPCLDEMPSLKKLEDRFQENFILLALSTDGELISGHPNLELFPNHLIFDVDKNSLKSYNIQFLPVSTLIDKQGTLRKIYYGEQDWISSEILQEIDTLIKEVY